MALGKVAVVVAVAACLVACADESPFGPGVPFTWNASQWSVSDRPDLGELQIVATNPQATGIGTAAVYRFNSGNVPEPFYAAAVQGWFLTHGQHCTASEPTPSPDEPQGYVFQYSCWVPANAIN